MLAGYWNGGAGCSIETLAELIGDTPKVAFDHYGREWGQHYQEPLWVAMGAVPYRSEGSASERITATNLKGSVTGGARSRSLKRSLRVVGSKTTKRGR
jgi:hypothetical protein